MADNTHLTRWLTHPEGGGRFTGQRDLILAHPSCESLLHVWLPRKGGATALSDIMGCDSCDITLFWEGLVSLFGDCPDSYWYFCRCCALKVSSCPCGAGCVKEPETSSVSGVD